MYVVHTWSISNRWSVHVTVISTIVSGIRKCLQTSIYVYLFRQHVVRQCYAYIVYFSTNVCQIVDLISRWNFMGFGWPMLNVFGKSKKERGICIVYICVHACVSTLNMYIVFCFKKLSLFNSSIRPNVYSYMSQILNDTQLCNWLHLMKSRNVKKLKNYYFKPAKIKLIYNENAIIYINNI